MLESLVIMAIGTPDEEFVVDSGIFGAGLVGVISGKFIFEQSVRDMQLSALSPDCMPTQFQCFQAETCTI